VLETEHQKIYNDYQMLLVLVPLGLCEDTANSKLAIALLRELIEHYKEQGAGVPRYEQHITMLSDVMHEFKEHLDFIA